MLDEGRPVPLGRIGDRRLDDLEVLRALVGGDVELTVVVVDVVLVAGLPGQDDGERRRGCRRRQVAHLGRRLGARRHEDHLLVERPSGADVEQLVALLEDQLARRADGVAEHLVGPLGYRVLGRVDERLVVGRPDDRADPFNPFGRVAPRAQVAHAQDILPVTVRVERVRQPVGVVADGVGPEAEELVALGELIEVEHDLFGAGHAALAAAHEGVLLPFLRARVVEVLADARRHTEVGLLDAPEHLLVERLLQRLRRPHHSLGVGVLSLEVGGDVGIGFFAEPEVVVGQRVAVDARGVRHLAGDGRDRGALLPHRLSRQGGSQGHRGYQRRGRLLHVVVVQCWPGGVAAACRRVDGTADVATGAVRLSTPPVTPPSALSHVSPTAACHGASGGATRRRDDTTTRRAPQ